MKWIAAIIVLGALEIGTFLYAESLAGAFPVILFMVLTGIAGAYIARRQGLAVLEKIRMSISQGRAPGGTLLDGACILAGAFLLILPGFFTDIMGLLFLAPPLRAFIKPWLLRYFRKVIYKKITIRRR
ncbi:FxsA family protein [Peribacillus kribbensis]|uniref:FxsA family protein n=1 Tax=Peribacillus kribbensis TaxID=356658 RepID=UPI0003FDB60C|nr:FxsA family protein [Peribacillus kribbensis]